MFKVEPEFYFSLSRRFTKCWLASDTTPSFRMLRLRFFDFLVRMWRLKAWPRLIDPLERTKKRFAALFLVFILGILVLLYMLAGGFDEALF